MQKDANILLKIFKREINNFNKVWKMIEQVPLSKWDFVKVTALCRSPRAKDLLVTLCFSFQLKKKKKNIILKVIRVQILQSN